MRLQTGFTSAPLLPVAVCLMSGIAVGSFWLPRFPVAFVLLAAVSAALGCRFRPVAQTAAILVCCVLLGMTLVQLQPEEDAVCGGELHGVVMSEPSEGPKTVGFDVLVPCAGGRTLRCRLWKDERSMVLVPGDAVVMTPAVTQGGLLIDTWRRGGDAVRHLSLWQLTRLWFLKQRHRLLQRYRDFGAGGEAYAVLAAMTLGDKSAQSADIREVYAVSGASHVLAMSGLHIGIVYMLLTWLMLGRSHFWLSQVVTLSAVWAFALLTGLSPSVTRAASMISVYAVFAFRGGRTSSVNVLCFAAIVMVLADVRMLFDVSFQLSFAAVFAIVVFMPILRSIYLPRNILLRWVWNILLLSTCAQLGVAPLIAFYFGRLSTYFLLTNMFAVPAAALIIYGSLASLACPAASVVLLWLVQLLNRVLRHIAALPGASIGGLHPTVLQVVLIYVLIGILAAITFFFTKYYKNCAGIGKKL